MHDMRQLVAVSFLCWALLLFFVAGLCAIYRCRSSGAEDLTEAGSLCSRLARRIMREANHQALVCQIGILLSGLLAGMYLTAILQEFSLTQTSQRLAVLGSWAPYTVLIAVIMVCLALNLVFLQVVKAVAFRHPARVLCAVAVPLLAVTAVFSPLAAFLANIFIRCTRLMGEEVGSELEPAVSAEELSKIVEISSRAGEIEDEERSIIQRVFTFSDTVVREVMTPRKDVVFVEEGTSLPEVIEVLVGKRTSRVLVIGKDLDDVKGVLIAKDLLPWVGKTKPVFDIKQMLRPAYFVPNSKQVSALLKEFKRQAVHFAVVLDEHGGVDGVVTMEDLMEEIVGEIFDEYDIPLEEVGVIKAKNGDLLVHGSVSIDDLNVQHGLNIPTGAYDTVAGLVMQLLGRIPRLGETVECGGVLIKVEELSQHRITRVRIAAVKS